MNGFADFIKEWGYIAVFLGSAVEGETVILTASALAAFGYLSIYKVCAIAFVTTVVVDQILFWIGYKAGTDWIIRRFPKFSKARAKVYTLLHKMDILFIFSFRFIYGIRILSPIVIGSAKVNPSRFSLYNTLSGLTWAIVSSFVGYIIADLVMDGKFDTMPTVLAITILIIIISGGVGLFFKQKDKKSGSGDEKF
ncbi:MAG: DedA family protein [Holosporales bacterium]|jgi:membrane protein DedA with SNARE-associated domain|nr:DedA family protein [Holosporales bacterium]